DSPQPPCATLSPSTTLFRSQAFVYAASSSTYGDHPGLPKVEDCIGRPLSPYAVTKFVNELYADVFARAYGFSSVGLRYFNVFGRSEEHTSELQSRENLVCRL